MFEKQEAPLHYFKSNYHEFSWSARQNASSLETQTLWFLSSIPYSFSHFNIHFFSNKKESSGPHHIMLKPKKCSHKNWIHCTHIYTVNILFSYFVILHSTFVREILTKKIITGCAEAILRKRENKRKLKRIILAIRFGPKNYRINMLSVLNTLACHYATVYIILWGRQKITNISGGLKEKVDRVPC